MVAFKGKKIILASDDVKYAQIIMMLLKSWGYDCLWFADGREVCEAVSRIRPDLVIADYDLSGLDGLTLIKILKSEYSSAHIPVLLMIEKKNMRRDILEIEQGLDDYLTKPPDPVDLEVRIEMALRRTEHQFFANPLTRLPASRMLEKIVKLKLADSQIFSFLYCDINNFKSFNDRYGYKHGDEVIMQTAHIITNAIKRYADKKDLCFHIGGDDFVVLSNPEREADIAKYIIEEFDRVTPFHYEPFDRHRGFIRIKDRRGSISDLDLMSISIAIVNNQHRQISSLIEFIEIAFEIKDYLKKHKRSRSLINRRKTASRIQNDIDAHEEKIKKGVASKKNVYRPLGQILLERNLINPEQLENALIKHWDSNIRLGQILMDMNILNPQQLEDILGEIQPSNPANYPKV